MNKAKSQILIVFFTSCLLSQDFDEKYLDSLPEDIRKDILEQASERDDIEKPVYRNDTSQLEKEVDDEDDMERLGKEEAGIAPNPRLGELAPDEAGEGKPGKPDEGEGADCTVGNSMALYKVLKKSYDRIGCFLEGHEVAISMEVCSLFKDAVRGSPALRSILRETKASRSGFLSKKKREEKKKPRLR